MKNFEYAAPRTEGEVLELLSAEADQTELLAGGTDLVGLMKSMVVTPDRVVSIMDVESMQSIGGSSDGSFVIGSTVTLDDVLAHPQMAKYPAVTDAILGINSMQLQSQGTIGGELLRRPRCWYFRNGHSTDDIATGDNRYHAIFDNAGPAKFVNASRIAPALIALDASVRVIGPEDEERLIPVADLYRTPSRNGQRETILQPNQLVTHIVLPETQQKNATYEVRDTEGPDAPLAAAAASLQISAGVVQHASVVLGQVAPTPRIASDAADSLLGHAVTEELADRAGEIAIRRATPLSQNEYKIQLAKVAVKRSILRAAGHETGGH